MTMIVMLSFIPYHALDHALQIFGLCDLRSQIYEEWQYSVI